MRLGFYYHIPAIENNGKILMPGYLGRFLDSVAAHSDKLILFLHVPNSDENANLDYEMQSNNISLISLPQRGSVPYRILSSRKFSKYISMHISLIDVLLVRGPSPLLPAMVNGGKQVPTVLLIVGDYLTGINDTAQPRWRKEFIRVWSWWNARQQLSVAKRSLTIVNSHQLYLQFEKDLSHLLETRTTTLTKSDFYVREDTCQSIPIHLLYTGRMSRAKGILVMVEALAILVRQGYDLVLDLVGPEETGDPLLYDMEELARCLGVTERICYHGYRPVGRELFKFYILADIYLIASQSSEGFPRTIWEAMANSLPVVATKVGSIPDFIKDAAELVEPKNSEALANGIRHLLNTSSLRRLYIRNGFELAKQMTLEAQVPKMIGELEKWLHKQ